eukprot:gnl/TRDRNA2_/TRDRNA2_176177_c1_seq12.p1 gnl/TRDRNA2_/TRDRNA2_176177_c1~~gnl/TRDRNA2_/TRDRNA2_176177_c1_seq12.p1  ORF type:complete len:105 (+),score=5.82 gnl/TRDRNA2_/TRDRNA2_176177_c1_seq12:528-842(+)
MCSLVTNPRWPPFATMRIAELLGRHWNYDESAPAPSTPCILDLGPIIEEMIRRSQRPPDEQSSVSSYASSRRFSHTTASHDNAIRQRGIHWGLNPWTENSGVFA